MSRIPGHATTNAAPPSVVALGGFAVQQVPGRSSRTISGTPTMVLLRADEHPKVVSGRLVHTSVSITLDIYSHMPPTIQQEAANRLTAIMAETGLTDGEVSDGRERRGSGE